MSGENNDLKRFREQWLNELTCQNCQTNKAAKLDDVIVEHKRLEVEQDGKPAQDTSTSALQRKNEPPKVLLQELIISNSSVEEQSKHNAEPPRPNILGNVNLDFASDLQQQKEQLPYNPIGASDSIKFRSLSSQPKVKNDTLPAFEIINACFKNATQAIVEDHSKPQNSANAAEAKVESFIDLLILDIDEITGIPFFDLELPKEIALRIFSFLSIDDLINCCYVNKSWKLLAEDDLLWFHICNNKLHIETNVQTSAEGSEWKKFAAKAILKRHTLEQNWRERKCVMTQLNPVGLQGGVLCTSSQFNGNVMAGYLNGSVLLWNTKKDCKRIVLNSECQATSVEQKCQRIVVDTSCAECLCAASYADGTVMVWQMLPQCNDSSIVYQRKLPTTQQSKIKVNNSHQYDTPMLLALCNKTVSVDIAVGVGSWENLFTRTCKTIISFAERIAKEKILISNLDTLEIVDTTTALELDHSVGAIISATDIKQRMAACALHYKGFHVLGGFRIKIFDVLSCKLSQVLLGPLCSVSCMNLKKSPENHLIVGCSDNKIRLFDMRLEKSICSFYGQRSQLTTIQMDDVKIVSGAFNGSVCVWDRRMTTTHLWENQLKHPIRLCEFTDKQLFVAAVPCDENPQESMWYIEDLMQHKRLKGSVSVFDFDVIHRTENIPEICQSTYDDMTGYDYNIALVTPFDDVTSGNLPQM